MNEYENNKSTKQHDAEMKSCSTTSGDTSKNKSKIVIHPNKDNHMTLHSHEGDVYNAALALLRLPTTTVSSSSRYNDVSSFQNIKHSVITPQQSFDSSKVSFSSLSTNNYTYSVGLTSFFSNPQKVDSSSSTMDNIPTQKLSEDSTSQHQDNTSVLFNSSSSVTSFCGTISLSMPADDDNLSPLHCFIRKFGIEAFVVSDNDAKDKEFWNARNFKVKPGIVGMQCMHCKHKPLSERGPKSVHYPSSTKCIYYSMENWQRNHAMYCTSIPKWILRELRTLMSQSKTGAGGRRRYWTDSAIALGMTDTPEGIKFVGATTCPPSMQAEGTTSADSNNQDVDEENHALKTLQDDESEKNNLVGEDDKHEISEYLFLLIFQMEACSFTEEDRSGSRSKVKDIAVGYPGIQCKHCHGKSGVGRYFPLSLETLTLANSDRNIHNHLQKCRRCPEEVKESLEKLRLDVQNNSCKIKRGARKAFFSRLWYKLHQDGGTKSHGNDIVPISGESGMQHRVETKSSPNPLPGNISNYHADNSKPRRMSVRNDFHYPNVLPSSLDDPLRYSFHPHYPKLWHEQRSSQQTTTRISSQGGNKNSGIRECSSSTEDSYPNKHYPNHYTFWSSRGQKTYYPNPSDQHQVYHPSYNEDWRCWKRPSTNNIHSSTRMTSWYLHPNRSDSCHHYEEDDHFIHSQSGENSGTTFIHSCHFPPHTSIDHEGTHQRDVGSITTRNEPSTDCRSHYNEDLSGYAEL